MAKPTTYATPICIVLSILVIIGIVTGVIKHSPLIITILLLPSVAYEAYRTEGISTRFASWAMVAVILAELVCIVFKINYNLASLIGSDSVYAAGYIMPLGDVKVIFPIIMIILSFILFFRTIGKYTKWLAVLIFASSVTIVYLFDPEVLKQLLRLGTMGYF